MNRNRLITSILTVALFIVPYAILMQLANQTLGVAHALPRFTTLFVGTVLIISAIVIIRDQRLEQTPERWARAKNSLSGAFAISGGVIIGSTLLP